MRINRSKFVQHLERLSCAGQCTEAVFSGRFRSTAITPDHLLLVDVPEFEGAQALEQEVGVVDLGRLIAALGLGAGKGNEGIDVDVYFEDHRLVLDDAPQIVQRLVTSAPKTIATRIEAESVKKLFATVKDASFVPLSQTVLEKVVRAYSLYKAEQVQILVGPEGVDAVVGEAHTHQTRSRLIDSGEGDEEYCLLFGRHLIDVFSIITDYSSAALGIVGPEKPVLVADGEYRYILSPRKASSDAPKKKAGKSAKKEPAVAAVD